MSNHQRFCTISCAQFPVLYYFFLSLGTLSFVRKWRGEAPAPRLWVILMQEMSIWGSQCNQEYPSGFTTKAFLFVSSLTADHISYSQCWVLSRPWREKINFYFMKQLIYNPLPPNTHTLSTLFSSPYSTLSLSPFLPSSISQPSITLYFCQVSVARSKLLFGQLGPLAASPPGTPTSNQ